MKGSPEILLVQILEPTTFGTTSDRLLSLSQIIVYIRIDNNRDPVIEDRGSYVVTHCPSPFPSEGHYLQVCVSSTKTLDKGSPLLIKDPKNELSHLVRISVWISSGSYESPVKTISKFYSSVNVL